jgi:hypothetical protein
MEFEVPPAVVTRSPLRRQRGVAAILLAFASIVGLAVASAEMPAAANSPAPRSSAGDGPAADGPAADGPAGSNPAPARAEQTIPGDLPADLRCRDVARRTCERMVRAAIRALPDDSPAILAATVWQSLLCGDSFDCPPSQLDGSTPLGSVTLRFVDRSPQAAINVIDGEPGSIQRAPRAWIVRWLPETGLSGLVLARLRQELP